MKKSLLLYSLSLLLSNLCLAQEIKVQLSLEQSKQGVYEVSVAFTVDARVDSIGELFIDDRSFACRQRSSNMSVIAGRYEYESNYVYRFKPWREGTYTFNSPVFVVNGDIIPSKEVEIEIDDIAEETETTRQDFDRWQATQIKRSANMRFTILGQKVLIEKRVKGAWEDYQIIPLNDFVFQLNSGTYEKL